MGCFHLHNEQTSIFIPGRNGEFNVKYFNWYPSLLKESIVFHHLHYKPTLANFTQRRQYTGTRTQSFAGEEGRQDFRDFIPDRYR